MCGVGATGTVTAGAIGPATVRRGCGCSEVTGVGRAMKIRTVAATSTAATNDAAQRQPLLRRASAGFADGTAGVECAAWGRCAKIASISAATDKWESVRPLAVSGAVVMFGRAITIEQPAPHLCGSVRRGTMFIGLYFSHRNVPDTGSFQMRKIGSVSWRGRGGGSGPEGSLLIFVIGLVMLVLPVRRV
jgi:hypothetical protein